jgi:hypothetical protein
MLRAGRRPVGSRGGLPAIEGARMRMWQLWQSQVDWLWKSGYAKAAGEGGAAGGVGVRWWSVAAQKVLDGMP